MTREREREREGEKKRERERERVNEWVSVRMRRRRVTIGTSLESGFKILRLNMLRPNESFRRWHKELDGMRVKCLHYAIQ